MLSKKQQNSIKNLVKLGKQLNGIHFRSRKQNNKLENGIKSSSPVLLSITKHIKFGKMGYFNVLPYLFTKISSNFKSPLLEKKSRFAGIKFDLKFDIY